MSIAKIRIPIGWVVEWNTLTEPVDTTDLPPYEDLTDDLLFLKNIRYRIFISLGWLPEFNHLGRFVLMAVKIEDDIDNQINAWDVPLRVKESRSFSEIIATIEDWLMDNSLLVHSNDNRVAPP
jgi:hypothetical protein